MVADHLSCLVRDEEDVPLTETFSDEQLLQIEVSSLTKVTPCYADIVNYLYDKSLPSTLTRAQKDKIKHVSLNVKTTLSVT